MADFKKAFHILERWEGGYANIKEDTGGETYKGITRKNYPEMSFWKKVDLLKKEGQGKEEINVVLGNNKEVEEEIEAFYKKHYWDTYNGDEIECQEFAENLLLLTVNAGLKRGIKVGQESCDIVADGRYGEKTRKAFNNATIRNVDKFNLIELEFYRNLVKTRPSNQKFLKGWENRAKTI